MNISKIKLWFTIVFFLSLLTACSPYIYQHEVSLFNEGVSNSITTLNVYIEERRKLELTNTLDSLLKEPQRVGFTKNPNKKWWCQELFDDYIGNKDSYEPDIKLILKCQVEPGVRAQNSENYVSLENSLQLAEALTLYANSLEAIVNQDSIKSLKSTQKKLLNSVVLLNANTKKNGLVSIPDKSLSSLATLLFESTNILLDQRRYKILKKTVSDMDMVIESTTNHLSAICTIMYTDTLKEQKNKLHNIIEAVNDLYIDTTNDMENKIVREQYLTTLIILHEELDKYRKLFLSPPQNVFVNLKESHHTLMLSLKKTKQNKQIFDTYQKVYEFNVTSKDALAAISSQ